MRRACPRPIRSAALLALLLVLSCLTGCGGGSTAADAGPASVVPPGAALYVEATVRPEGKVRENALAAAGKVLHTGDPSGRIKELVQQAVASGGDPKLDYARDIEPWLGDTAGLWMTGGDDGKDARGLALVATTDAEKTRASIDAALERGGKRMTKRSYKGVDYEVDADGEAFGIVDDFAAFGTERELKGSIDASKGDSLADSDRYRKSVEGLEKDRLAHFYLDFKPFVDQALRSDPSARQQLQQLRGVFDFSRMGPIAGSLTADGERLMVDASTKGGGQAFQRLGALAGNGSTPLLGDVPGDSWGAIGSPKLGETLRYLYQQFAGALGGAAIQEQLRQQLGLDLERDVFSWMGDAAFFVRGTTKAALEGGAIISVTDDDRAKEAFPKLVGVLRSRGGVDAQPVRVPGAEVAFALRERGQPKPVVLARGKGRVVVAYGERAAADGFSPQQKFADSESFREAEDLLGDGMKPGFVLSMPAVVELAQSQNRGDPDFEKARPYLEAFSVLAAGADYSDDDARSRAVAGLK